MSGSTRAALEAAAYSPPPRRVTRAARSKLRPVASLLLTLAILGTGWLLLAPPQLGGTTSFVVVDGTSMLPTLQGSDLVALRPTSSPEVGDVVGYRSALLDRVVLHRISAIEGGRYVLKGDNNSFVDPDRPLPSEIVGKVWFHAPKGGHVIAWLHVPWVLAAVAALFVLAVGLDGVGPRSRGERESLGP
jgi:signal peptidase I